jgi:hypothetical protein
MSKRGNVQQCAWEGCDKASDKRNFGQRRPIDASLQSPLLKNAPHSSVLCNQHGTAWARHLQEQSTQVHSASAGGSGVDALLSAAAAAASSSSSSAPRAVLATVVQPQPSTPRRPPQRLRGRQFGSNISNVVQQHPSPLRRSFMGKTKRRLLAQYKAVPRDERAAWLQRRRLDFQTMSKWKKRQEKRNNKKKKDRPSQQRRREYGGGRKALLGEEKETAIRDWVVKQRQGEPPDFFRYVVTVSNLVAYANNIAGRVVSRSLSDGWLQGYMDRQGLALRTVTTNKVSDTPDLKAVLEEFRFLHRELLSDSTRRVNLVNMDETAIFYDMHHNRTIDIRGVRTVAAHPSQSALVRKLSMLSHSHSTGPAAAAASASACSSERRTKTGPIHTPCSLGGAGCDGG